MPFSLAHSEGTLWKVNKSVLLALLERDVNAVARLSNPDQTPTCLLIDSMMLIQTTKTGGSSTFGDMAMLYYKAVTTLYDQYYCNQ